MSFSNYLEDLVLHKIFADIDFGPLTMYIALWIGDPGENGLSGAEVSGSGYTRKQTSSGNWSLGGGGIYLNNATFVFPEATGGWGSVTHFALFTAISGGFMLMAGPLQDAPIVIASGSLPRFAPSTIVVQLD